MAYFMLTCLVAGLLSTSLTPSWGYVPPSSLCPESWAEFEGRCFKYFPELTTWEVAEQNCRELGFGRDLVSVHNAAQNTFLYYFAMSQAGSQFTSTSSYWIGVNDIDQEGTFINADGSQFDYMDWLSGEPNSYGAGEEDCVHVGARAEGQGWNDISCSTSLPYICQLATPCSPREGMSSRDFEYELSSSTRE